MLRFCRLLSNCHIITKQWYFGHLRGPGGACQVSLQPYALGFPSPPRRPLPPNPPSQAHPRIGTLSKFWGEGMLIRGFGFLLTHSPSPSWLELTPSQKTLGVFSVIRYGGSPSVLCIVYGGLFPPFGVVFIKAIYLSETGRKLLFFSYFSLPAISIKGVSE